MIRPVQCSAARAIATLAAAAALSSGCADKPLPSAATRATGPARIVLDVQRQTQAAATATVDVQVSYQRTAGGDKQFFDEQVAAVAGVQQVTVSVNLADCLADPTHVGASGACTMDVVVVLLDASKAVLDRQAVGPLVATPGGTATSAASLYTPTQPLAVGSNFACTISVGTTYCWGSNSAAELGDGTTQTRFAPVQVTGGFRFVALAAGFEAACGLTPDGIVACWGLNLLGEVGDGTLTRNKSTPGPVAGTLTFKSVYGGTVYFCGLTSAGAAYCWGINEYGQLGDGTTTNRLVPTPVTTSVQFTSIAPGMLHTCGLTAAGAAYCWGDNTYGAVGDGTNTSRLTPVPVTGGLTFASITAGSEQSCGVTSAGVAYCWGRNDSGEIGDGTTTSRTTPTLVSGGHTFTKLQGAHNGNGEDTTCGIATDGTLYCWGSNRVGQIGDGTLTDRSVPTAVSGALRFTTLDLDNGGGCALTAPGKPYCWGLSPLSSSAPPYRAVPTAVSGAQNVIAMSAGTNHSCALVAGGAASCWGYNSLASLAGITSGFLGIGTVTQSAVPAPVAGGLSFSAISTGYQHTCALAVNGAAYCWGSGANGALGNVTGGFSASPGPVSGGLSFSSIGVGSSLSGFVPGHSCGLTATGAAFCWGVNQSGQVGDGSTTARFAPVAVTGGRTFTSLAVGGSNTCGLVSSGAAFCWGANANGEVGSVTASSSQSSPVAVAGGLAFTVLATGGNHSCGLTAAGAAYCWGRNVNGQLGNGVTSTTPNPAPVAVTGGLTFTKIAAGTAHTCALTAAGLAWCWGRNVFGGLGDGSVTDRSGPVAVLGGKVFVGLSLGADHTCGWTVAGAAYCWGTNLLGQVGDGTTGESVVPVLIPLP